MVQPYYDHLQPELGLAVAIIPAGHRTGLGILSSSRQGCVVHKKQEANFSKSNVKDLPADTKIIYEL